MSYLVLARKYRPKNFAAMIGQEHVKKTLTYALENDRLHHAYLFTGTRGVGKTTIARIFAKCVNNPAGVTAAPDESTAVAKAIDAGKFLDLVELDAASNTGVDSMRELLDNAYYPPSSGRYKVYLIDEVHMLSMSSFNALLKTLEEPPAHLIFLFATTDPKKLPITIVSRCLQMHLKHIAVDLIRQHLQHVLTAENITFEPQGLDMLAQAGQGSMRDALSLTDQAIAFGNGSVNAAEVSDMLGIVGVEHANNILRALLDGDGKTMLNVAEEIASAGSDPHDVIQALLALLQAIATMQITDLPDQKFAPSEQELIQHYAATKPAEDIQLYYQILFKGLDELYLLPNPMMAVEMLLLRALAFMPAPQPAASIATPAVKPATTPQASNPIPAAHTDDDSSPNNIHQAATTPQQQPKPAAPTKPAATPPPVQQQRPTIASNAAKSSAGFAEKSVTTLQQIPQHAVISSTEQTKPTAQNDIANDKQVGSIPPAPAPAPAPSTAAQHSQIDPASAGTDHAITSTELPKINNDAWIKACAALAEKGGLETHLLRQCVLKLQTGNTLHLVMSSKNFVAWDDERYQQPVLELIRSMFITAFDYCIEVDDEFVASAQSPAQYMQTKQAESQQAVAEMTVASSHVQSILQQFPGAWITETHAIKKT